MAFGVFPGVSDFRKRTQRSPDNPMDRCTVVSIYPKEVDEVKHTIQPGRFIIPPGTYEKPSTLVVGSSSWWKELDEESPLLEIPQSSILIANSIIVDYINGILGCNMNDAVPGLFYLPGNLSVVTIQKEYKAQLDSARTKQINWFKALVIMADTLWSRSQGNPLSISDDMRLAARELNLNSKEWLADFQAAEMIRCASCGNMRNPLYPICPSCHMIIDKKRFDELGLSQVK